MCVCVNGCKENREQGAQVKSFASVAQLLDFSVGRLVYFIVFKCPWIHPDRQHQLNPWPGWGSMPGYQKHVHVPSRDSPPPAGQVARRHVPRSSRFSYRCCWIHACGGDGCCGQLWSGFSSVYCFHLLLVEIEAAHEHTDTRTKLFKLKVSDFKFD